MNFNKKFFTSLIILSVSQNPMIFASSNKINLTTKDITCLIDSGNSFIDFLDGLMVKAFDNKSSKASIYNALSSYYTYKSESRFNIPNLSAGTTSGLFIDPTDQTIYDGSEYNNYDLKINYNEIKPFISLDWDIFDYQTKSLSKYYKYIANSKLANSKQEIIDQAILAASSYINLVRYSKDLQIITMLQKLYKIQIKVAEGLKSIGEVSQIDVNSAKASYINYKAQGKILKNEVDFYKNQILNTLYLKICQLPFEHDLDLEFNFPNVSNTNKDYKSYISSLPNIKELENNIAAYKNLEKSFSNNFLPRFAINLKSAADFDSGNISGLKDGEYANSYPISVTGTLTWNFYNGGKDKADKKSSSLKKEYFQNLLEDKKYTLKNDLVYKTNKINSLLDLFKLSKDALDILEDQVNLTNLGYKSGYIPSINFRNTATNYFQTAQKVTYAWSELLINYLNYESGMLFPSFPKINKKLDDSTFNFGKLKN